MPSSRASRRAYRWSSTAARQSYAVAGESEAYPSTPAKGKKANKKRSKAATKPAATKVPKVSKAAAKPKAVKTPVAVKATAADWKAAFGALMVRLPETPRQAVGAAAAELAPKMVSESRREVFKHMATAAGAKVAKVTGPKPSARHRVRVTESEWSAGFTLLMYRLEPSTRTLVAQLAGQRRTGAQDPAQRQAFERMRVAATSEPRARVRKPA